MKKLLVASAASILLSGLLVGCSSDESAAKDEEKSVEEVKEVEKAAPEVDYSQLTNENVEKAINLDNLKEIEISDEGDGTYYLTAKFSMTDELKDEETLGKQAMATFKALREFKTLSTVNLIYFDANDELVLNTVLTREKSDTIDFEKAVLGYRADRYIYIPQ